MYVIFNISSISMTLINDNIIPSTIPAETLTPVAFIHVLTPAENFLYIKHVTWNASFTQINARTCLFYPCCQCWNACHIDQKAKWVMDWSLQNNITNKMKISHIRKTFPWWLTQICDILSNLRGNWKIEVILRGFKFYAPGPCNCRH